MNILFNLYMTLEGPWLVITRVKLIFSNTKKDNSSIPPWQWLAVHHCMPVSWPSWFGPTHKVWQSSCPFHLQSGRRWAPKRHIPSHFYFHKIMLHWCPVKDTIFLNTNKINAYKKIHRKNNLEIDGNYFKYKSNITLTFNMQII